MITCVFSRFVTKGVQEVALAMTATALGIAWAESLACESNCSKIAMRRPVTAPISPAPIVTCESL